MKVTFAANTASELIDEVQRLHDSARAAVIEGNQAEAERLAKIARAGLVRLHSIIGTDRTDDRGPVEVEL